MPNQQQLAADRQYLAQLDAQGDIDLKKPPAQMSDAYVHRLASQFHKQQQLNLPVSTAAARGHARKEHGHVRQEVAAHEFRPAAYEAVSDLLERSSARGDTGGRVHIDIGDIDRAFLERLAADHPDVQMFISAGGTELFTHGGIKPQSLLDHIDGDFDGDMGDMWDYEIESHEEGESP